MSILANFQKADYMFLKFLEIGEAYLQDLRNGVGGDLCVSIRSLAAMETSKSLYLHNRIISRLADRRLTRYPRQAGRLIIAHENGLDRL